MKLEEALKSKRRFRRLNKNIFNPWLILHRDCYDNAPERIHSTSVYVNISQHPETLNSDDLCADDWEIEPDDLFDAWKTFKALEKRR